MQEWEAAKNALECVLEAKRDEHLAIFCDDLKIDVAQAFAAGALKLGLQTWMFPFNTNASVYRSEIPQQALEIMAKYSPDIYINLLRGTREETPFRIKLIKTEIQDHKARLGHCPGVTSDMLTRGALALSAEEHRRMQDFARNLMQGLKNAVKLKVTAPAGTDLTLSVEERPFFTDTMLDWKTMKWMNLPTGEVIIAPVETSLEGKLACDTAIGGIGPIKEPLEITAKNGLACDIFSNDPKVLRSVRDSLSVDQGAGVVGEFAFGINPKARLVEEFLEAEKILGTVHLAFGNNTDMPSGKNDSKNHMDFLISKPTVEAFSRDGSELTILAGGTFRQA